MRYSYLFAPLFVLTVAIAIAPVGGADKPTSAEPQTIKLPAAIAANIVSPKEGVCYAVTTEGRLMSINLEKAGVKTIDHKDKLLPCLDCNSGRVCLASEGKVSIVDVVNNQPISSLESKEAIRGVGFLNSDKAFCRTDTTVTIFNVADAKVVKTIDLGSKPEKSRPDVSTHTLVGQRLFVTSSFDGSLLVVDLDAGKVTDRIATEDWRLGGVMVSGEKAFVVGLRLGYGVWTQSFGVIDLKTKKLTALKLPASLMRASTLLNGPDNTILLVEGEKAYRYDAEGKLLGPVELATPGGKAIGYWNGRLLLAGADNLRLEAMK
jgi:hypothetical protein